jgi:hypothetical protein
MVMASNLSTGAYVAQIIAYEDDILRLLHKIQLYIAGGHAIQGSLYTARFSSCSSAVEKRLIRAANISKQKAGHEQSTLKTSSTDGSSLKEITRGEMTITLLHINTTWRFDTFATRLCSPTLAWPAIRTFFRAHNFVEADLILVDQSYPSSATRLITRM